MNGARTLGKGRHPREGYVLRTLSISPRTEARLTALTNVSGTARGKIIDMMIDMVAPCACCRGTGVTATKDGEERCVECAGEGLVPS